jgi:hypothetical protein
MKHRQFLIGVLVGLALGSGLTLAIFLMLDRKSPTIRVASGVGAGRTFVAVAPGTRSDSLNPRLPEGAIRRQFNGEWFYILPLDPAVTR